MVERSRGKMSEDRRVSFFADDMVRRLARLLRTIGYDVRYEPSIQDNELAEVARSESRIILTRDTSFAGRFPSVPIMVFDEDNPWLQFREVVRRYNLDVEKYLFTRCTLCNGEIAPIAKQDAAGLVPAKTYEVVDEYYRCSLCRKIYWEGSHTRRIRESLAGLFDESDT